MNYIRPYTPQHLHTAASWQAITPTVWISRDKDAYKKHPMSIYRCNALTK
ncbi:MAG: hypothetical protein Q4F85_02400 [Prevotella sp.]|nr:hypothetical protein [Prevotella sp.]